MGSSEFINLVEEPDIKEAFRKIRDSQGYERGHSYSGSIAQKSDYVIITRTPMLPGAAKELAGKMIAAGDARIEDKWGPAGAIPVSLPYRMESFSEICGPRAQLNELVTADLKRRGRLHRGETVLEVNLTRYTTPERVGFRTPDTVQAGAGSVKIQKADAPTLRVKTMTVVVTGTEAWTRAEQAMAAALAKAGLGSKERINKITYQETALNGRPADVSFTYKAELSTPAGTMVTRYVLEGSREHGSWETGFGSMAAARAFIQSEVRSRPEGYRAGETHNFAVVGICKRSTGEPLLRGARKIVKTSIRAQVEIIKDNRVTPTTDGWYFFGYAPS
jgi:hypothetical protein